MRYQLHTRLAETHSKCCSTVWHTIPEESRPWVLSSIIFILGITLNGDWMTVLEYISKYSQITQLPGTSSDEKLLQVYELGKEFLYLWFLSNATAYSFYFILGGFLHWHYYYKQRDHPETWKCQPQKWLSAEFEWDEIVNGSIGLLVTNSFTAVITFYVRHDGWSQMYLKFDEYTWFWWILQWPVIFIIQDYSIYNLHRMYHTPYFYKRFHKLHHRYKQPTAFSVTAIHPLEILHIQITTCLPMFIIPFHWLPYYGVACYTYYNGIMDHSGIDFKAPWWQPWRPDTMYHDNHHQYFHVNFSFNCYYWDILHDTYRKPDRIYNEDVFYGRGKSLNDATSDEIRIEKSERSCENPRAHRREENFLLPKAILNEEIPKQS